MCDGISPQGICDVCRKQLVYIRDDFCLKCGKPLTDPLREYCDDCRKRTHVFVQGRSLLSYQGAVKGSLYRLKYGNRREYAGVYAAEAEKELGRWIGSCRIDRIVPIPLHPARRRKRGYNQAELLAQRLGELLQVPVDRKLLVRTKNTAPQKNLTGTERGRNLKYAFAVAGTVRSGEHILLVDDIYTTGSTVDMAAYTLMMEENCLVYVFTVAIGG